MKNILIVCLSVVFYSSIARASDVCDLDALEKKFDIPVQISRIISVEEIKEENLAEITLNDGETKRLFQYGNKYWEELKTFRMEGDCIVYFISRRETWRQYYGREGIMLARDGNPIYWFLTREN